MCNSHWYYTFCTGVTLFCTRVTHFCTPFSANQNRVIFSCMLLGNKRVDDRGHRIATRRIRSLLLYSLVLSSSSFRQIKGLTHETSAWFR